MDLKFSSLTLKITIIWFIFSNFLLPKSLAENVLKQVYEQGLLKVAIREDSPPLGYLDPAGILTGYCLDFIDLLVEKIKQESGRQILTIKLIESTIENRFSLLRNQQVYLECGPNTIRSDLTDVWFSQPFFHTGTKFLVKKNNLSQININGSLRDRTIGVLINTTTESFIRQTYPEAKIKRFYGATGKTRAIQAVSQGKIALFASDDILIRGELLRLGFSLEDYKLIPSEPLTCDLYGMILPLAQPQWRDLVNRVINSQEMATINQKWFGNLWQKDLDLNSICR
ncbi:MAG: amino acid ABC transporter substrate-binding protein [Cyanobacteria bacterium J083]|nr:MAG: amino acid ABC transporter substrate-binding protein [Cyanobacteria bacterium J083]